jgi:hypothetical protein
MFRPRLIRTVATAAFLTAMLTAAELRAQGTLGFTIDPTQGPPGTVVNGQVNVADVTASCVTDLAAFQARFEDVSLNVLAFSAPDPLYLRFFPPDVMDIITTIQTHDQLAYTLTLLATIGIGTNQGGAAETAFPQTFVITFPDPNLNPIGELGHFDPATGVGSVVVPDLAPGPAIVAAACVGPDFDRDALEAGIRESGTFLARCAQAGGSARARVIRLPASSRATRTEFVTSRSLRRRSISASPCCTSKVRAPAFSIT